MYFFSLIFCFILYFCVLLKTYCLLFFLFLSYSSGNPTSWPLTLFHSPSHLFHSLRWAWEFQLTPFMPVIGSSSSAQFYLSLPGLTSPVLLDSSGCPPHHKLHMCIYGRADAETELFRPGSNKAQHSASLHSLCISHWLGISFRRALVLHANSLF